MFRTKLSRLKPATVVTLSIPGMSRPDLLDFSPYCFGALQRSGKGKLDVDVEVALVLLGQESCWAILPPNQTPAAAKPARSNKRESALANQRAAKADVSFGGAAEHAVEPTEERARASPRLSSLGRSSSAESAGLSVSALKAEMSTEMAMVTANC